MSALVAAYGVQLDGRELALLCQKAENLVVGAPCGVMDQVGPQDRLPAGPMAAQPAAGPCCPRSTASRRALLTSCPPLQMASSLGEEGQLLALLCQPAEVQGLVPIPRHIRLWGVDSGIRHSVGGADYGSVRVGTYMGRTIIRQAAQVRGCRPQLPPWRLAAPRPGAALCLWTATPACRCRQPAQPARPCAAPAAAGGGRRRGAAARVPGAAEPQPADGPLRGGAACHDEWRAIPAAVWQPRRQRDQRGARADVRRQGGQMWRSWLGRRGWGWGWGVGRRSSGLVGLAGRPRQGRAGAAARRGAAAAAARKGDRG
jgi:hypothetical protein